MIARILVADESPSLIQMLHLLKGRGYATVFATDGETVASLVRAEHPDLIVCDARLSDGQGRLVIGQMLKDVDLSAIPKIALIEGADLGFGRRRAPAGFVDYVAKPIDAASFLRTVERHIPVRMLAIPAPLHLRGRRRRTDLAIWRRGH